MKITYEKREIHKDFPGRDRIREVERFIWWPTKLRVGPHPGWRGPHVFQWRWLEKAVIAQWGNGKVWRNSFWGRWPENSGGWR